LRQPLAPSELAGFATRLYKIYPGAIAWVPAIGLGISVPFYLFAFTTESLLWAGIGLSIAGFSKYGYLAAQYTIGQGVVTMRVRATATAVLLFIVNLLGYGFGPSVHWRDIRRLLY
jgi:hypothetical protein